MLPVLTVVECLAIGLFAASHAPHSRDGERESLEEFLYRARVERDLIQGRLRGQVMSLVRYVEHLPLHPRQLRDAWTEEAVALGAEASPLLVAWIDPGEKALAKESIRSIWVSYALCRMDSQAITGDLLRVARKGTLVGQRNAVRVLATSREWARVRPTLLALFHGSNGDLRVEALEALIRIDDPQNDALLCEALDSSDELLVDMAVEALAAGKNPRLAERIGRLLADPVRAAVHIKALLRFYRALPELVREREARALVRLAGQADIPSSVRAALVDSLPLFVTTLTPDLRKELELLVSKSEPRVREGALILLSILGDKNARGNLLKVYESMVQSHPDWWEAFARRADVLRRIHDYENATRDYLRAIKFGANTPQPDTYIGLARCFAIRKMPKSAAMYLEQASLSVLQLRALAHDPDFAEVRAHPTYGEVFRRD